MRGLVETLHDMDFRVMLWWAPLVVEEAAAVNHRPDLVAGPFSRGQRALNYTSPATQAWVRAKLELWFGTAPGCWHLDGLKLDFLAEQIYPVAGGDPEWRGEERQMHHIWALAHEVMSKYNEAPAIWTAPHSPHLLPYMIALGTEERFDRDMSFLTPRPAMQQALCPGAWFSPHFNYHPDSIEDYCHQMWALGGIPQIGKLLTPEVTPDHLARIRQQLARWPSPSGC
jgi:hypothetical protein